MKRTLLILTIFFITAYSYGEGHENTKRNILRFHFINPGIEYEHSITEKSKISVKSGYGVSMSYPNLTAIQPNHAFFISPFLNIHYKYIYNINKRQAKNKDVNFNSGNFWGFKHSINGPNLKSELNRTNNFDFSLGPTWGLQRNFYNFFMMFGMGPVYYYDTKGNSGFYPLMIELCIGFNLK